MLPPAAGTDLEMAAEGGRATPADAGQDALLTSRQELSGLEARAMRPDDVRDVVAWGCGPPPRMAHGSHVQILQRAPDRGDLLGRDPRVDGCGLDTSVAQHHLDLSKVRPVFQQVRRERMPEHVGRNHLADPRPGGGAEQRPTGGSGADGPPGPGDEQPGMRRSVMPPVGPQQVAELWRHRHQAVPSALAVANVDDPRGGTRQQL